jgi:hypothetical protein
LVIADILLGELKNLLHELAGSQSKLGCPVIGQTVFERRQQLVVAIEQPHATDNPPVNEVDDVNYTCLANLYLRFSYFPLDRWNQHILDELLAELH